MAFVPICRMAIVAFVRVSADWLCKSANQPVSLLPRYSGCEGPDGIEINKEMMIAAKTTDPVMSHVFFTSEP
jgi:hypothetical protein